MEDNKENKGKPFVKENDEEMMKRLPWWHSG